MSNLVLKDDDGSEQLLSNNFIYNTLDERTGKYLLVYGSNAVTYKAYVKDNGRKLQIYFINNQDGIEVSNFDTVMDI